MSKLEPGKRYQFQFKTGSVQIVEITSVEAQTISGYSYQKGGKANKDKYSDTFDSIELNVAKISVFKYNPGQTITLVAVPVTVIIILIAIIGPLIGAG